MNRRDFLKSATLTIAATVMSPSIVGCNVVGEIGAKTVGKWFLTFVVAAGAGVVADAVSE